MLRTNLATRPFYNERAVQLALGAVGLVVLGFTLFNVVTLVQLSGSQSRLGAHAAEAEREAGRLRTEATRIRTQIDPKDLQAVSVSAREANGIIDRRAFSWTELFGQYEATLPADVRIKAVQPRLEKDVFFVAVIVQARKIEDVDAFIEALEATGAFRNVRPLEETSDKGLIEAVIEAVYTAPGRSASEAARE